MVVALSGITFKCVKHSFKICLQTLFSNKKLLFNFWESFDSCGVTKLIERSKSGKCYLKELNKHIVWQVKRIMLHEKFEDIALSNWTGWINKWHFFLWETERKVYSGKKCIMLYWSDHRRLERRHSATNGKMIIVWDLRF